MTAATLVWSDLDCFALPPLAARAVSGRVTVRPLCASSGRPGADEVREYTKIDLDAWARDYLADLDALGTEPFASIARKCAAAPHERLCYARRALAEAIAARLRPIRAGACDADTLGAARALLARRLQQRLADAYRIAVVKVVDRLLLVDAASDDCGVAALPIDNESSPPDPQSLPIPPNPPSPPNPPFPLCAVPDEPSLVLQSACFARDAGCLEAALCYDGEWQFDLALRLHDRFDIRIDLDAVPPTLMPLSPMRGDTGLLAVLAQHQASRDAVWTIVGALGEHPGAQARDPDALVQALDACATLAEQVREAWLEPRPRLAVPQEAPLARAKCMAYAIKPVAAAGAGRAAFEALNVECTTSDVACVWPQIAVSAVSAGDAARVGLAPEATTGSVRVYRFAPDSGGIRLDAGAPVRVFFSLPSLSLLDAVRIRFSVGITRNEQLFGRDAPPTDGAFVCDAASVAFATDLQPLGDNATPIDIGEWSRDLAQNPLTRLLDTVFRAGSTITQCALEIGAVSDAIGASGRPDGEPMSDPMPMVRPLLQVPSIGSDQHWAVMQAVIERIAAAAAAETSVGRLESLIIGLTLYGNGCPVLRLRCLRSSLVAPPKK